MRVTDKRAVQSRRFTKPLWRTLLWLAATTALMQLTTILTFGKLQVGYSLALFQLSTLISRQSTTFTENVLPIINSGGGV